MGINDASKVKGDSKPKLDAEDIGADHGTELESISSVGEKNISTRAEGGGDGSVAGASPNTYLDPREVEDKEDAQPKIKSAE